MMVLPFFELSQPNGPNRRLTADIALVSGDKPIRLIEAKKFSKTLDPGYITHYLSKEVMGAVTNGNYWIFVLGQTSYVAGPILDEHGDPNQELQFHIISVLKQTNLKSAKNLAGKFFATWSANAPSIKPKVWSINKGLGTREYATKQTYERLSDALAEARAFVAENSPTEMLLEELQEMGSEIARGTLEVSENRLVWWLPNGKRAIRLNLKSRQIDMLALTELISLVGENTITASIKMHDKNRNISVIRATNIDEVRVMGSESGRYSNGPDTSPQRRYSD
jgi:hypothetical protein